MNVNNEMLTGKVPSQADAYFIKTCREILEKGYSTEGSTRAQWADGSPAHTIKKFGVVNRYDLSKEFPAISLRPVNFKACVDEILWIWQKKSNKLSELNSHIWDEWGGEDGTIGKAYGYQLAKKYQFAQGFMDQVDNVLWQLKSNKNSRRILTNIYNFEDIVEMNLEPCAYSMTFNVTGDILNGILNQRSQDMLVANGWNICQYAVLMHMFAQATGLKVGELIHVIADAHIYNKHVEIVKELIDRPSYPAPKLWINPDVTDFYDFTVDDFRLEGYEHNEQVKNIPVAV